MEPLDTLQLAVLTVFYVGATAAYAWAKLGRQRRQGAAPPSGVTTAAIAPQSPKVVGAPPPVPKVTAVPPRTVAPIPRSAEAAPAPPPWQPLEEATQNPVEETRRTPAEKRKPSGSGAASPSQASRFGGLFGSRAKEKAKEKPKETEPKAQRSFGFWKRNRTPNAKVPRVQAQQKAGRPAAQQVVKQDTRVQPAGTQERVLVDSYSVYEPFVRIAISLEPDGTNRYVAIEPELTKTERSQLAQLKAALRDGLTLNAAQFAPEEAKRYLADRASDLMKKFGLRIPKDSYAKIFYFIERDFLCYGKLDPLMRDPNIEDISCNGPGTPIYVFHRSFESVPTNVIFRTQENLERYILRLAYMSGRHISVAEPVVDAALPDGSRIQMTFGSEITKKGSTFTIRKFREDPYSVVDLIKFGTINADIAALFWYALESKGSVLLSGGTASGKTTSINCLAVFIRPEAKIVTIEDTPEINLVHTNWIESVSRQGAGGMGEVTLYDLLRAALRQRPDFIVVGEVRGEEAATLFQALSTGHSGMSSIHADSIQAVFNRLTNPPMNIPRNLIPSVNFVVQQNRINVAGRPNRRIMSVTEVVGLDTRTNEIITNEAYRYDPEKDTFTFTGRSYILEKYAKAKGVTLDDVNREVATRRAVIQWMADSNIKQYRSVAKIVQRYYTDKSQLLAEIGAIAA